MYAPIVFSIGCPACNVLIKKLIAKDIPFQVIDDPVILKNYEIDVFPMMQVEPNGELLDFGKSIAWVNAQEEINGNN